MDSFMGGIPTKIQKNYSISWLAAAMDIIQDLEESQTLSFSYA